MKDEKVTTPTLVREAEEQVDKAKSFSELRKLEEKFSKPRVNPDRVRRALVRRIRNG